MQHPRAVHLMAIGFITSMAALQGQTLPAIPVDPQRLTEHVKVLASDAFEGRGPASPAEAKVIDYVVAQMTAAKLTAGGDPDGRGGRRWTQDVPLAQAETEGSVVTTLRVGNTSKSLVQGEDIAIRATHLPTARVSVQNAPLIFLGYGVHAPERQWDDFKGIDLRGKIGIVLVNDPDFEADLGGRFDGKSMTYYGRWSYKYEEGARRGAQGILVVHETAPAAYGWASVKNSFTGPMLDIVRENPTVLG